MAKISNITNGESGVSATNKINESLDSADNRPATAVLDLNSSQTIDMSAAKVLKVNATLTSSVVIDTISNPDKAYDEITIDIADPDGYGVSFDAALDVRELGQSPTSGDYSIYLKWLGGTSYEAIYPDTPVNASGVSVSSGSYDKNLTSSDDTAQKVADKFNSFQADQQDGSTQDLLPSDAATLNLDFSNGTHINVNLLNFAQNPEISLSNVPMGFGGTITFKQNDSDIQPTWASGIAGDIAAITSTENKVTTFMVIQVLPNYYFLAKIADGVDPAEAALIEEFVYAVNYGNNGTTSPSNWTTAQSDNANNANDTISDLVDYLTGVAQVGVSMTNLTSSLFKSNGGYDSGVSGSTATYGITNAIVTQGYHLQGADSWATKRFAGLDDSKYYQVYVLGTIDTASTGDFRAVGANGTQEQLAYNMQNNTTPIVFANVTANSGVIDVGFKNGACLAAIVLVQTNKPA